MAKPRVTATNRLADVIEVVELGRRTGLLMVERGSGEMMEEGALYFHAGRAMYAAVERVRGQDALAVLGGWGACRFSFDPDAARPTPNLAPPQSTRPSGGDQESWTASPPGYYSSPSQVTQRSPAAPRSWPTPASQPHAPSPTPQGTPTNQPTGPFGSSWPDPRSGSGSMPGIHGGMNGGMNNGMHGGTNGINGANSGTPTSGSLPLPQGWPQPGSPISGAMPPSPPPTTFSTSGLTGMPAPQRPAARAEAALLRRPRRAPTAHDLMAVVQNYHLSRAHRTLLMLADGEHNVIDIARLSSKQIEEVQALLGELEASGLVYYS